MPADLRAEALPGANTDRELWRETEGDFYAPHIHVTVGGGIGIGVGGHVVVMPVREWHALATCAPLPADLRAKALAICVDEADAADRRLGGSHGADRIQRGQPEVEDWVGDRKGLFWYGYKAACVKVSARIAVLAARHGAVSVGCRGAR